MRIALVTAGFPPRVGGVERVCAALADGLAEAGDDVTVVTFGRGDTRDHGYPVLRVRSFGGVFELAPNLVRTLRSLDVDVVSAHNLHATAPIGAWLARTVPYVLTGHYHGDGHSAAARLAHPLYRPVATRVVRDAAAVTAVSVAEADLVEAHFGVRPVVIPNGVAAGAPGPRVPDPDGRAKVVVVARLLPYKRVDAALEALAALPWRWTMDVVGDGPDRSRLERLAAGHGLAGRVRFHGGGLDDRAVGALVRDADVLLNMSEAEAFSLVVLEALAAGTPVVVNGGSGLRAWAERYPGAVVAATGTGEVAGAVASLEGTRPEVDLREHAWPGVVARYREMLARAAGVSLPATPEADRAMARDR
jgi:1,2-diacylglycerol 3-alpha-glucosyltransferase